MSADHSIFGPSVGFDKFYGYIAGEQSLFTPNLIDGTTNIGRPAIRTTTSTRT